jgi:hypothetical protein
MKIKKHTKYKIKQKGGWNDTTFDNFRRKVTQSNDALKQTDQWWDELKEELNFYAEEMSDRFMAEPRFRGMDMGRAQDFLDIIVLLMLDISIAYSRLLIDVVNKPKPQDIIELVNRKSVRLKEVLNIDFVEFVQILLDYVKTTGKFAESNTLGYVDPRYIDTDPEDFTTTLGLHRLAQKINRIQTMSQDGHYGVYKEAVLDSVKLLDVFLLKAYTGEYGELQARSIVCKDYFFDSIINKQDTIKWVYNLEENSKKLSETTQTFFSINQKRRVETDPSILKRYEEQAKQLKKQIGQLGITEDGLFEMLNLKKMNQNYDGEIVTDKIELLSKSQVKEVWKELYEKLRQMTYRTPSSNIKMRNLTQGDRVNWKEYMEQWKETFRLLLYSSLVNRNQYSFFQKGLERGDFDKDIKKEYEQFQVKLAVFYKRLLIEWIGFSSLEEYNRADPDTYKNKLKVDRRFLDIIRCIEDELDRLTEDMHPRNNEDSDTDSDTDDDTDDEEESDGETSKLPSTRHTHLYHPDLEIDVNEDSDDEFERIGSEYVDFLKGDKSLEEQNYHNYADIFKSLKKLARDNNPYNIPEKYVKNLGKIVDVKINGIDIRNSLIIDVTEKFQPNITDRDSNLIDSKEYEYLIALGGIRKKNLKFGIDPDEYEFSEDDPRASRDHETFLEVAEFDVRDPALSDFRWNGYNFDIGDTVYYIILSDMYSGNKKRNVKDAFDMKAIVIDKIIDEEDEYEDRLTELKVEMADSDVQQIIPVDSNKNVNLTRLGAIYDAMDRYMKEYGEREDRQSDLLRTFEKFKQSNEFGEPTYHLDYSRNRRGNPNLDRALRERGFDGMDYIEDMVEKMTDLNPDKKIDTRELNRLRGKDSREKHHQNLFPERIGYLEAIIEDDKEFEAPEIPTKRWEREPYGWDSDEEMEEDFDGERRLETFLNKKRTGVSRPLQRNWYRKQRIGETIGIKQNVGENTSKFQEVPEDLVEDNPVFQDQSVNRFLKRTLKNRYRNPRLTSNLPARRMGISQSLRESFRQRRPTAREISRQTDRRVEQRTLRNRRRARELDDDILRQSRLIDGRTPVQVMDLQNRIDYRRNVPRTQSENVVRRIDRERQRRLERFR